MISATTATAFVLAVITWPISRRRLWIFSYQGKSPYFLYFKRNFKSSNRLGTNYEIRIQLSMSLNLVYAKANRQVINYFFCLECVYS
jgi:hypothetical protein